MRNTLVPLTIAFIDDEGRIVNMADMEPLDERSSHCPARPVRFALEMSGAGSPSAVLLREPACMRGGLFGSQAGTPKVRSPALKWIRLSS